MSRPSRIAFAGDRDVAVSVLEYLLGEGVRPLALLISDSQRASHAHQLRDMCGHLEDEHVLRGANFRTHDGLRLLGSMDLDFIVSVHFPYIAPREVLSIPRIGILNLHPAYLPYNRGWHTPSWAILEGTPAGATLHFMDAGIDTGDIVARQLVEIRPDDTANSLYARLKAAEVGLFKHVWPALVAGTYERQPQSPDEGTAHRRSDLFQPEVQRIDLDTPTTARDLLRRLRALTTNRREEAAYFEEAGRRYRIQVAITLDEDSSPDTPHARG